MSPKEVYSKDGNPVNTTKSKYNYEDLLEK